MLLPEELQRLVHLMLSIVEGITSIDHIFEHRCVEKLLYNY